MARRALIIGISRYVDGHPDLTRAATDAKELAQILEENPPSKDDPWDVDLLDDTNGRNVRQKDAFEAYQSFIENAAGEDLLLYFSGHADLLLTDDKEFEVVAADGAWLSSNELKMFLIDNPRPPRSFTLILDACNSARLMDGGTGILGLGVDNLAVFLASRQEALEDELRGGYFTHYVKAGLNGDGSEGGTITARGLERYLHFLPETAGDLIDRTFMAVVRGKDIELTHPKNGGPLAIDRLGRLEALQIGRTISLDSIVPHTQVRRAWNRTWRLEVDERLLAIEAADGGGAYAVVTSKAAPSEAATLENKTAEEETPKSGTWIARVEPHGRRVKEVWVQPLINEPCAGASFMGGLDLGRVELRTKDGATREFDIPSASVNETKELDE